MQSTSLSKPKNIILDFDGTITTKDTISTLAKIGITHQKAKGKDLTAAWDNIVARYEEEYSKHLEIYRPEKEKRINLAQEIAYYRNLRKVEFRSFERISKSEIFKGISEYEWKRAAGEVVESGEVVVRKGFGEFMLNLQMQGRRCGVVSVNFSSYFIKGVLEASCLKPSNIEILANLPDENGALLGPKTRIFGESSPVMATSDAKLSSMKYLLSSWAGADDKSTLSAEDTVYIGDSGTDIECLVAENVVGIVITEDGKSSLKETLERVKLPLEHIQEYQERNKTRLYWAHDFQDILNSPLLVTSSI